MLTDISSSAKLITMIYNTEQRLVSGGPDAVVTDDLDVNKIYENVDFIFPHLLTFHTEKIVFLICLFSEFRCCLFYLHNFFFNRELYVILLVDRCWKSIKNRAGINHVA